MERWAPLKTNVVYEPFGGTGTFPTVSMMAGMDAHYSEVNPFMRLVIESKTNHLRVFSGRSSEVSDYFAEVIRNAENRQMEPDYAGEVLDMAFPGKPYFTGDNLIQIVALRESIESTQAQPELKAFGQVALGSIGIQVSGMKRQGDLRYKTPKELLRDPEIASQLFRMKAEQIVSDLPSDSSRWGEVRRASNSALVDLPLDGCVDFILTSPPYLNGTNYFRNTKLELWLSGLLQHESELAPLTREAMVAGINNVSRDSRSSIEFAPVQSIQERLFDVAYDSRIPRMVEGYFSDSFRWLTNCARALRKGGRLVLDIGDSSFAGVHIPVDEILLEIASLLNLNVLKTEKLRDRRSKDGTPLKQVIIVFEKV